MWWTGQMEGDWTCWFAVCWCKEEGSRRGRSSCRKVRPMNVFSNNELPSVLFLIPSLLLSEYILTHTHWIPAAHRFCSSEHQPVWKTLLDSHVPTFLSPSHLPLVPGLEVTS